LRHRKNSRDKTAESVLAAFYHVVTTALSHALGFSSFSSKTAKENPAAFYGD